MILILYLYKNFFSGLTLARNGIIIFFLGIIPLIAGFAITIYLIFRRYGSSGTFFKATFSKKTAVPTISQQVYNQRKSVVCPNVSCVSSIPPIDSQINIKTHVLKVKQATLFKIFTPIQEQPNIFQHNTDEPKIDPVYENLKMVQESDSEVLYENVTGVNSGTPYSGKSRNEHNASIKTPNSKSVDDMYAKILRK